MIMALAQLELFSMRPATIASRRFSESNDGYDREEVQQFLGDVADYLSRLQGELEWRRARRQRETGTLIEQEEAVGVVAAARQQAEKILAEARTESDGYVRLARAIAYQLAVEARDRRQFFALAVGGHPEPESDQASLESPDFEKLEVWMDPEVFKVLAEAK
jgi:DivIVA domain-containing protein